VLPLSLGDAVAKLQQHRNVLPTELKCLAPLLEGIREAYERAAPPHQTPVTVRHQNTARFVVTNFTFRFIKQQSLRVSSGLLKYKASVIKRVELPQILVYMAALQEARLAHVHTNKAIFGMLSDGAEFRFTFLDSNKKFHCSRPLSPGG
jgi:hypothetical protein